MKKILTILMLGISAITSAQQIIKVVDKTDLQPIDKVEISGSDNKILGVTDANGQVELPAGTTGILMFSHFNYQIMLMSVEEITKNENIVALSPQVIRLNEAVVSASRFEEKKEDVAKKVDVIYARDIEKSNAQSTADLLMQSGGVNVQKSQQGGGSPMIRGFEANKVLIVVDGIRMNNAIYRGGHLQNVIRLDNNSLEKLEVVFGPGSLMYGSDALGGVMHFHTKSPIFSATDKIYVDAGTYVRTATANQEKTGHVDFTLGGKSISSFTSFTCSDFGDLRQGDNRNPAYGDLWKSRYYVERINGQDSIIDKFNMNGSVGDVNVQTHSGYSQYNLIEKFAYKTKSGARHMINFQMSNTSNVHRYDRLTDMNGGVPVYAEFYYGPEKHMLTAYQFSSGKATKAYDKMNISIGWQDVQESRLSRKVGSNKLKTQIEDVDIYNLNADLMKNSGKHEMRYGIEGTYNIVASTAYNDHIDSGQKDSIVTRYPQGGSTYLTLGAYYAHNFEISDNFILTGGLRFNTINLHADFGDTSILHFPFKTADQKNSALNGSFGIIYKPCESARITLLGSTGFRAPNIDDMGKVNESTTTIMIVPNVNLTPEKTTNLEFGIQNNWKNVSLSVNAFYTGITDLLAVKAFEYEGDDSILVDGTLAAVFAPQNVDQAYVYGISADLKADITDKFSIVSTITYTYGRMQTDSSSKYHFFKFNDENGNDSPLDHIPPVFGKTSFQYNLKKFGAEFFVLFNGWKKLKDYSNSGEDNLQYATPVGMPSWTTLNLRASYQFTKNIKLQVACENITDLNYRVFASGISAPGRNLVVTIRGNF